ncbi:hypothetical protein CRENBAI_018712 [Crenichthys baileyi]|uniref:Protein-glutamine gamma-glutamyltransferase 2 n=1 Tax=Crenichthys baileyi TaxID=28760 RepID=A0AAV9S0T2_9TELE
MMITINGNSVPSPGRRPHSEARPGVGARWRLQKLAVGCCPPDLTPDKRIVFIGVDLHSDTNNYDHRTSKISVKELIVRRGQPFKLTLKLASPFKPTFDQLTMTVATGEFPSEDLGTMSHFGVPDKVQHSASAKAVWRAELQQSFSPETGILTLTITPPADSPVGEYKMSARLREEERELANLSVLFNPWCPGDWVFLSDEEERKEYVMNEHGIIYKGADNYIFPITWDYGQFEEDMVKICMKILDLNFKHKRDPADDVSARCNPIYVSRVITSMINNANSGGILQGNWGNDFRGGLAPTHWSSSYVILKKWYNFYFCPVKFGQCWVFAGVMCSVMRLLGIPCRVVTNYQSAHDTDSNLTIDTYYADYGVKEKESRDSIWNYHVWVEGWMRRPDLAQDRRYDGWQALDPTPQEKSEGIFCCGPAPVSAILNGHTNLKYDAPFVFAAVNADCKSWLVKRDGSMVNIHSDTSRIGQNISTKSVSGTKRMNITGSYKHTEGDCGSVGRVVVFQSEGCGFDSSFLLPYVDVPLGKALNLKLATDYSYTDTVSVCNWVNVALVLETEKGGGGTTGMNNGSPGTTTQTAVQISSPTPPPQLLIRFEEVSKPVNGEDVNLRMILKCTSSVVRELSININAQAMKYTGQPAGNILTKAMEMKLLPGNDHPIPILIPFLTYNKLMTECESINISAMITDKLESDHVFLAENRIVLMNPPISINTPGEGRLNKEMIAEVLFMNPVKEILRDCSVTLSGSGLFHSEIITRLPDLLPNNRVRVKYSFVPYRSGERTLLVDFDCSSFRDIKKSCTIIVRP